VFSILKHLSFRNGRDIAHRGAPDPHPAPPNVAEVSTRIARSPSDVPDSDARDAAELARKEARRAERQAKRRAERAQAKLEKAARLEQRAKPEPPATPEKRARLEFKLETHRASTGYDRETAERVYEQGCSAVRAGNRQEAIEHFASALRIDPTHIDARAELGRLRFVAPLQPLVEELKRRNPVDVCEVVIEVRNACNYRCSYCVAGQNDRPVQELDLAAVQRTLETIEAKLVVTSFDCGGGEPTIHPQFPALLELCATRGPVSFPTNNSQNPERWLPKAVAHRIYVRAALHPESEERLDRYLEYARYLIEAGSDFASLFVSHPTRIPKIPAYRQYFAEKGVPFTPVSFIGEYEGRRYPHAYSNEEKEMLGLNAENRSWFHKIEPHATRLRNFRGIPCLAGFRSIYIGADGNVRRCRYDKKPLAAPLAKPEPCRVKNCGCGLVLEKLNSVESVEFHNSWAPKAGLQVFDLQWISARASELGYSSVQDGLAAEHTLMYDELMRAYGKDEFIER
jgi:MoaA/NifB/PqqE/SkfB family radical SAM enzyme